MTKDERADNFQRVFFGGEPIRVVEPDRWHAKHIAVGVFITILISVFGWLIAWPLFVRDVKAVVEFWK